MSQPDLFAENMAENKKEDLPDFSGLFELSVDAYYTALYAQMSELPIEAEISRFINKVKKAGLRLSGDRAAAERTATDRGDHDVLTVLKAAGKVQHEIHRITGFLRFNEKAEGIYIARCAPDHCILPVLADHFTLRFGETPWAIIDEKRNLCLYRKNNGPAVLIPYIPDFSNAASSPEAEVNTWEDLWRLYYRSINNEPRKNLHLQRQLMPERYRRYLPETSNM